MESRPVDKETARKMVLGNWSAEKCSEFLEVTSKEVLKSDQNIPKFKGGLGERESVTSQSCTVAGKILIFCNGDDTKLHLHVQVPGNLDDAGLFTHTGPDAPRELFTRTTDMISAGHGFMSSLPLTKDGKKIFGSGNPKARLEKMEKDCQLNKPTFMPTYTSVRAVGADAETGPATKSLKFPMYIADAAGTDPADLPECSLKTALQTAGMRTRKSTIFLADEQITLAELLTLTQTREGGDTFAFYGAVEFSPKWSVTTKHNRLMWRPWVDAITFLARAPGGASGEKRPALSLKSHMSMYLAAPSAKRARVDSDSE